MLTKFIFLKESYELNKQLMDVIYNSPEISLGDYQKLPLSAKKANITEVYLENVIKTYLSQYIDTNKLKINFHLDLKSLQLDETPDVRMSLSYKYSSDNILYIYIYIKIHQWEKYLEQTFYSSMLHELTHVEQQIKNIKDSFLRNTLPHTNSFKTLDTLFVNKYFKLEDEDKITTEYVKDRLEIGAFSQEAADSIFNIMKKSRRGMYLTDPEVKFLTSINYAGFILKEITKNQFLSIIANYILSNNLPVYNFLLRSTNNLSTYLGKDIQEKKRFVKILIKDLDNLLQGLK